MAAKQLAKKLDGYTLVYGGQVLLFVFLIICLIIIPHYLFEKNEGGISNYGLYAKTIVPFTLSTLSGAGLAIVGARYLKDHQFRRYLFIWAVLALLSLISTYPYKVNHIYGDMHQIISIVLFIYEIIFAAWMVFKIRMDKVNLFFWITQLLNFILGVLNRFNIIHILFIIEVWEGLAFAVILIRSYKISYGYLQK